VIRALVVGMKASAEINSDVLHLGQDDFCFEFEFIVRFWKARNDAEVEAVIERCNCFDIDLSACPQQSGNARFLPVAAERPPCHFIVAWIAVNESAATTALPSNLGDLS
jgi:hypothetical protein